jgi:hypothetical protein
MYGEEGTIGALVNTLARVELTSDHEFLASIADMLTQDSAGGLYSNEV